MDGFQPARTRERRGQLAQRHACHTPCSASRSAMTSSASLSLAASYRMGVVGFTGTSLA
jgi:hypothetical protein